MGTKIETKCGTRPCLNGLEFLSLIKKEETKLFPLLIIFMLVY